MDFLSGLVCARRHLDLVFQGPDWLLWLAFSMLLLIIPCALIVEKCYTNEGFQILVAVCFLVFVFISQNYCLRALE